VSAQHDVIVVGGGHNGLIAGAYLARSGRDVLVLEKRDVLGGATVTEEIYPGFRYSVFSYVVSLLRPEIVRELELARHGLVMLPLESTLTPLPGGGRLYRSADRHRTRREIARFSVRDADAYVEFGRDMHLMARAVKHVLGVSPPDLTRMRPRDLLSIYDLKRHFLGLGERRLQMLWRLMTMPAADFLERWFESEPLLGTLSASGIIGTFLGPRSPGSAYVLLHHYMGEIDGAYRAWGFARGGTGAVAEALASSARSFGATIRTGAGVERVLVRDGRAHGVALASGEELEAANVVSGLDPRQTFLRLLEPGSLPDDLRQGIERFRFAGSSAKVNLALDAAPQLDCAADLDSALRGAISISPSIDYVERAYDDAKYGQLSRQPYIDALVPSFIDPSLAPPGKHVMSCFVQYAPYHLRGGDWDSQRDALGDVVVDTLAQYIPNLKSIIRHRQVLTPVDIERITGLSEGNIFQGELGLSQLFFLRPAAGWARYRTPIRGYWQCGSGTHPGGGIMGAPGRLMALELMREEKA